MSSVKWLLLIVAVVMLIDGYCYHLAAFPQRKGLGRIPFIGGPLALIVHGRHKQ